MKTVMQDIAKLANVSPGTVSNALNNRKGVGKETKVKILKVAEELGYFKSQKKSEEKILRLIKFKKHGFVVSDTPFFSTLIEACEKECRSNGYELLISQVVYKEHTKEDIEKLIKQKKIDGILLLGTEMDEEDLKAFEGINIPMVVVDSYFKTKNCDFVLINNTRGSYMAVQYLIDNGYTDIGIVGSSVDINNFKYRYEGFIKAMIDNNIDWEDSIKFMVEPTIDGSYNDFKKILENKDVRLPKALFAYNDIVALGVIKAMNEKGIRVPEDVSIIGFDDIIFSELSNPPMTTVKVPIKEMGKISIRRLIEKIESEEENINLKIEISTSLIERQSVNLKQNKG